MKDGDAQVTMILDPKSETTKISAKNCADKSIASLLAEIMSLHDMTKGELRSLLERYLGQKLDNTLLKALPKTYREASFKSEVISNLDIDSLLNAFAKKNTGMIGIRGSTGLLVVFSYGFSGRNKAEIPLYYLIGPITDGLCLKIPNDYYEDVMETLKKD